MYYVVYVTSYVLRSVCYVTHGTPWNITFDVFSASAFLVVSSHSSNSFLFFSFSAIARRKPSLWFSLRRMPLKKIFSSSQKYSRLPLEWGFFFSFWILVFKKERKWSQMKKDDTNIIQKRDFISGWVRYLYPLYSISYTTRQVLHQYPEHISRATKREYKTW